MVIIIKKYAWEKKWYINRKRKIEEFRRKRNNQIKLFNIYMHNLALLKASNEDNHPNNDIGEISLNKQKDTWNRVKVPSVFSIEENESDTVFFFNQIFNNMENLPKESKIYIDSSNVKKVSPSALMYLIALLFDVKSENFTFGGNFPLDKSADRLYSKFGFKSFINRQGNKIEPTKRSIKILKGNYVDPDIVRQICEFASDNCKNFDTFSLYGVLIELMSNTRQHAYDEILSSKLDKSWLLFAEKKDNAINFVFLDTGQGIPETVKKNHIEKLSRYIPLLNIEDSKLIESALYGEYRTKTKMPNRGQGLQQLNRYWMEPTIQSASVFSCKGSCKVKNNDVFGYDLRDLGDSLYGTLYEWSVKRSECFE